MKSAKIKIVTTEERDGRSDEIFISKEVFSEKEGKIRKNQVNFKIKKVDNKYQLLFFYDPERYWLPVRNMSTFNTYIEALNQINLIEEGLLKKVESF